MRRQNRKFKLMIVFALLFLIMLTTLTYLCLFSKDAKADNSFAGFAAIEQSSLMNN